MKKIILTKEQEQAIIDYYLDNHSIHEASSFFNYNRDIIRRALKENNIPYHSQEKIKEIGMEHMRASCREKYGVDYFLQTEECAKKSKKTCMERYGVDRYSKTSEYLEKSRKTKLEKYGSETYNNREMASKTCIERYGSSSVMQSDYFKNKTRDTCLKKYGVENGGGSDEAIIKIKAAWENKTDDEMLAIQKKHWKKYKIDNIYFGSFPELCFYLFYTKANKIVKRVPKSFTYEFKNKKYRYFPDFEIDNKLYEIKSTYLLKKLLIPGTKENAKYLCILKNNVEIVSTDDYQRYIDWFFEQGYKKEDFIV